MAYGRGAQVESSKAKALKTLIDRCEAQKAAEIEAEQARARLEKGLQE